MLDLKIGALAGRTGINAPTERSIAAFVLSCERSCAGGPGPDCVILEDLAEPAAGHKAARGCA